MSVRWWDDAVVATAVLEHVDGSDVVQGVGTAALGLHALAKAAIVPLAHTTLVDRAQIGLELGLVDVTPVAKALARATEPLLGEGAERYGALLADEWVRKAQEGMDRIVQGLVARGLPMPVALERAAEAAGLPANRTARFIEALKDVALPLIVASDAADRALMEHAAAVGRLEDTGSVPVAKTERFEREHPRGQAGRFREKEDPETRRRDERLARRERLDRLMGEVAQARRASAKPAETGRAGTLGELAELVRPQRVEPERVAPERVPVPRVRQVGQQLRQLVARRPAEEREGVAVTHPIARAPDNVAVREYHPLTLAEPVYVPVLTDEWDDIRDHGMNPAALAERIGVQQISLSVVGSSRRALEQATRALFPHSEVDWSKVKVLEFGAGDTIPVSTDVHPQDLRQAEPVELSGRAVFAPVKPDEAPENETRFTYGQEEPGAGGAQDYYPPLPVPTVKMHWINQEHMDSELKVQRMVDEVDQRNRFGEPEEFGMSADFGKADEVWRDQRHHRVERNEAGEFAASGGAAERKARRERLDRLLGLQAQARRAQAKTGTVAELAALPRVAPERVKPGRVKPERVAPERARTLRELGRQAQGTVLRATAAQGRDVAEREFETTPAVGVTAGQLDSLFGPGTLDDLIQNGSATVTARPDPDKLPMHLRPRPLSEALEEWRAKNVRVNPIGPRGLSEEDAREVERDWNAHHLRSLAYSPEDAFVGRTNPYESHAEASFDHRTGTWHVDEVSHNTIEDEGGTAVMMGDPAALVAARVRDGARLRLEVVATSTHGVAEYYGVNAHRTGGAWNAPSLVIRAVLLDDED